MRRPIVAGNWKMNNTVASSIELVNALKDGARDDVDVVVCPPFTALHPVGKALYGSGIALGGQNLFWEERGAYTGQISAQMLIDCGCRYVILGHSESRGRFGVEDPSLGRDLLGIFGDTDATVNVKARAALAAGLTPIVCCGELLNERQSGVTDRVVSVQVERALTGLTPEQVAGLVIAYEPVWAIGTGEVCAPEEANRVCGVARATVTRHHGRDAGRSVRIQYGGSVKPDNAAELLGQEQIDGALVGGASLKARDFLAIVQAA